MSSALPSQAHFWGLREPEVRVLRVVTYWFNGQPLEIRGEKRCIATHPDPRLEELFLGTQYNYEEHAHAHDRLLTNGFFQEEYVCRRLIDWGPTQQGLRAIRDCLTQHSKELQPEWASDSDEGPLYGDPSEGVVHRKGVETAGRLLPLIPWAYDIESHLPYGVEWYPTNGQGQSCHDLHVDTNEMSDNIGVEVITNSNNLDHLVKKWKRFQHEDRITLWIFDNRSTACKMFNELDKREEFFLDSRFNNYGNWSAKSINHKIWRSSQKFRNQRAYDIVQTVTGLLESDEEIIYDLFDEHYNGDKYN